MEDKNYIECLREGKGSLKYYKYWTAGIILKTKEAIREAIALKLRILRQDKITKNVELFNYKTKRFEVLK